jgi:antitoxin Phd
MAISIVVSIMQKQYSIAEARDKLASIVHEVEEAGPVTLTRRGKAVAVLIAKSEYERLRSGKLDFWSAVERFRASHDLNRLAASDLDFEGLRNQDTGREAPW